MSLGCLALSLVRATALPTSRSAARAASRCLRRAIAGRRRAGPVPGTRPRGTIWRSSSLWGLSRTRFISTDQGASQARAVPLVCPPVRRRAAPKRLRHRHQAGPAHPDPPRRTSRTPAERSCPRATGLGYPLEPLPKRDSAAQPGIARVPGGTGRTRWVSRGPMRHALVANVRLRSHGCRRALRDGCPLWVVMLSYT